MTQTYLVFVGSLNRAAPYFQGARGIGLSVYAFDPATMEIDRLAESSAIDNPTFLSVTDDGSRIYANSEVFEWHEGLVTALRFDRETNALKVINSQPTLGSIAAHNMISRDGRTLLVANYGMGDGGPDQSVAAFAIREHGGLAPPHASVAHRGTGHDPVRQERSHAHSATETIDGRFVLVADLGLDKLISYRLADGTLKQAASFAMAPGAGPRHVALHPQGRFVFVMNELDSSITSLSLDADAGELTLLDTKPAVPESARDGNHCADIQISPGGRFVYGSNRGHDSIAVFGIDQENGSLSLVDYCPCGGATPRNLALTPSGDFLFSANQNADTVTIFARDADNGRLTDTGRSIAIGTPMCVRIVR